MWLCISAVKSCIFTYKKPLFVNFLCVTFIVVYSVIGGLIFLHFEQPYAEYLRELDSIEKTKCVEGVLDSSDPNGSHSELARRITEYCMYDRNFDEKQVWNIKNAMLYGFGILTTLGYGKIEPRTTNGRIFTVIYGFLGVPITVIIFTNFGRYLQNAEKYLRKKLCRRKAKEREEEVIDEESIDLDMEPIAPLTLVLIVALYLILGAFLISNLHDEFDFFNGIYFAFLCFTAIEYGEMIPSSTIYLPVIILYICLGLALSTIALDIGSAYVRKLYYIGKKLKHIGNIRIWFGSKDLRIKELLVAVGQNIGIESSMIGEINLQQLITDAIYVKEGKLLRVPQRQQIMEGIWPPELVPLFMKDGYFPDFLDADMDSEAKGTSPVKEHKTSISRNSRIPSISISSSGVPLLKPYNRLSFHRASINRHSIKRASTTEHQKKLSVRFEDVAYSDGEEDFDNASVQHLPQYITTELDQGSRRISDLSASIISRQSSDGTHFADIDS